jgi:hypothetical protein
MEGARGNDDKAAALQNLGMPTGTRLSRLSRRTDMPPSMLIFSRFLEIREQN